MSYWTDYLLVGFLLPVFAGFLGSWLWAKYDASDFAARRSVTSTQERIKTLEQRLREFERVFADTKLFLARVILDGVTIIVYLSVAMMGMVVIRLDATEILIMSVPNVGIHFGVGVIFFDIVDVIGVSVFLCLSIQKFRTLVHKCVTPDAYKSDLSERIARLRSRLSHAEG